MAAKARAVVPVAAAPLDAIEMAMIESLGVREDAHGYVFVASAPTPIGRVYTSNALTPQHELRCHRHSGKCSIWISSRKISHYKRLWLWLVAADRPDVTDASSHLKLFHHVVKPL